jgi:Mg2+ and Co2+ transporter CorA
MCCGHALVVVGDSASAYFTNREAGVLGQFRHQHFLLFPIAHFQKAALLRFTHRYWIHEVSEQAQAKALFHLCAKHLDLDALYAEVRERIHDMNHYLDTDSLRRQANTVVRLTVVTAFGLIGTVATGFLGMNLIAEADASLWRRAAMFLFVLSATIVVTVYTITKSKPLSDEGLSAQAKMGALLAVWGKLKD